MSPYVDDGKKTEYKKKISKKEEKALKNKGYKAFDVRYGVSFPRGGKIKVWAKNEDDAHGVGFRKQSDIMMEPTPMGHPIDTKLWKKPKHPKTRTKRKNNPRYVPVKVKRTHPKTGKKFTQTMYVHSKDWWKHPR